MYGPLHQNNQVMLFNKMCLVSTVSFRALRMSLCNVNLADKDGGTPLNIASLNGHIEVTKKLLAYPQININQATKTDGSTPLLAATKKVTWKW